MAPGSFCNGRNLIAIVTAGLVVAIVFLGSNSHWRIVKDETGVSKLWEDVKSYTEEAQKKMMDTLIDKTKTSNDNLLLDAIKKMNQKDEEIRKLLGKRADNTAKESGGETGKPVVSLTKDDNIVRSCSSGIVIGTYQANLPSKPLDIYTALNAPAKEESANRTASFQRVFNDRAWGEVAEGDSKFSASGPGSTVRYALEDLLTISNLINELKITLNKSKISILDVPCGDMQFMSVFLQSRDDIDYTGVDIVPELIEHHKKTWPQWRFKVADMSTQNLGTYDIIHNRHVLPHLHYDTALRALARFSASGSRYILTTLHTDMRVNKDLRTTGGVRFRRINLMLPPYSMVPPLCLQHDARMPGPTCIGLWKLPIRQVTACDKVNQNKLRSPAAHIGEEINSCTLWT